MNIFYKYLNRYFEQISLVYHLLFICFLVWVSNIKTPPPKGFKIPLWFCRLLGLYVIVYGTFIFIYGYNIFNQ